MVLYIAGNFDKEWRGDHKNKIMDRPFKPKYGTVSQSTLAPGCSKQPHRKDQKTSYKYKKPRKVKKVAVVDPA